jgi:hypothetical protein
MFGKTNVTLVRFRRAINHSLHTCISRVNEIYVGGYFFMLVHFSLTNLGIIHNESMFATGTLTVLSWFSGWYVTYFGYQLTGCRIPIACYVEFLILWSQLLSLGIGAGVFSRTYFGWIAGHDTEIFQQLSLKYLDMYDNVPDTVSVWWSESVAQRYTGIGWWLCEVADILFHQCPFIFHTWFGNYIGVNKLLTYLDKWIFLCMIMIGPLQRILWDLSTCGTLNCDGPYHGFLAMIPQSEQLFWHTLPCVVAGLSSLVGYKIIHRKPIEISSSEGNDHVRQHSVMYTSYFVLGWLLLQVTSTARFQSLVTSSPVIHCSIVNDE